MPSTIASANGRPNLSLYAMFLFCTPSAAELAALPQRRRWIHLIFGHRAVLFPHPFGSGNAPLHYLARLYRASRASERRIAGVQDGSLECDQGSLHEKRKTACRWRALILQPPAVFMFRITTAGFRYRTTPWAWPRRPPAGCDRRRNRW
jgi:hypothetical protein